MDRKILITGGAGFVGSNLAISFSQKPGMKVAALDNLKRRGSELNLPRLKRNGVAFIHGDIRNPEDLELDFTPDVIIECSAEPSVLAGYNSSPSYLLNTNLCATINCLEAARKWRADFIFLSTSRVYPIEKLNSLKFTENCTRFELNCNQTFHGASGNGISHEFSLEGHRSLYGMTKLCSEHLFEEYHAMYGLKGVVNRCGVIAGPWQMGKIDQGVFVHWMGSHYFKKDLSYFGYGGTGKQVRDLLHIDDLFTLIEWQVENLDKVNGKVFNVGGGKNVSLSLNETTSLCNEITGNKVNIKGQMKEREADVRIYMSDTCHAYNTMGWKPAKNAPEILKDIFEWIKGNEAEVRGVLFS